MAALAAGGVVRNAETGKPIPGVTVAAFNQDGKVVDTDITDEDGLWVVEVGWREAHLKEPPRGRGLFSSIVGVVTWPVKQVVNVVNRPLKAVLKGAAKAAGGAAAAGATVAAVAGAGPVAAAAAGAAGSRVGQYAVEQVVGDEDEAIEEMRLEKLKNAELAGQVRLRVWKEGYRDFTGAASVYLLDQVRDENDRTISLAYVDPILLASANSGHASSAPREIGLFQEVTASPAIVPAGQSVKVRARIQIAREIKDQVVMLARVVESSDEFQLYPAGDGWWEGTWDIHEKARRRNYQVAIVAYRTPKEDVSRDRGLEGRVAKSRAWEPGRPFPVDPAVLASRNRGYVVVTVTDPTR